MARAQAPPPPPPDTPTANPLARIAGRDAPARAVLAAAAPALARRGISSHAEPAPAEDPGDRSLHDYAQIDPALAREPDPRADATPPTGVGYGGLTAAQRARFLRWLDAPHHEAPPAFHTLYLAYAETAMLEALTREPAPDAGLSRSLAALRELDAWPAWRRDRQRTLSLLLGYRLLGDGHALAAWIAGGAPHAALTGVALGQQALLGAPLTPDEAAALALAWNLADQRPPAPVLALRLNSLTTALGADPLARALAALGPVAPKPWRTAHRDLRLALPQPDLRAALEPLLAELLDDLPAAGAPQPTPDQPAADDDDGASDWHLILEFGHSRSDYFDFALDKAQRLPGYVALLDEQRHMVHRVHFRKSEMRRFWPLWDYVQNWADTRVYANGVELEKWKIWPYSQYLK